MSSAEAAEWTITVQLGRSKQAGVTTAGRAELIFIFIGEFVPERKG